MAQNIQSGKKPGPTTKITLLSKAVIQNRSTYKELLRQEKAKGIHHHQTSIKWNVKGSSLRRAQRSTIWQINDNTCLPTIESKQQSKQKKQNKNTLIDTENILTVVRCDGVGRMDEKSEGTKEYTLVVTE